MVVGVLVSQKRCHPRQGREFVTAYKPHPPGLRHHLDLVPPNHSREEANRAVVARLAAGLPSVVRAVRWRNLLWRGRWS